MTTEIETTALPAVPQNFPDFTPECRENVIDLKLSMAGYNAFYYFSSTTQQRTSYAVALHTNLAIREGRYQDPDRGPCAQADAMRRLEVSAGRALYFIDRRETLKKLAAQADQPSESRYGKPRVSVGSLKTHKVDRKTAEDFANNLRDNDSTPKTPAPKKADAIDAGIMGRNLLGEAVNNMMKESSKQ